MGVNEDMLELENDETLFGALNSDAIKRRSAFMWIGKIEINSLMRKADMGLKFKDKMDLDEDEIEEPMVYTPSSPGDLDFYHPDILLCAIIEDLLGQHTIVSSDSWNWIYEESKDLMPVSIVPHMDIVRFFDLLTYFFLIKTI